MANYTKNYNLILPEQEDYYDVEQFNSNADTIDAQMAETEQKITGLNSKLDELLEKISALDNKLGTAADTGSSTLYGLLNSRKEVFKSWNRYTYTNTGGQPSYKIAIKTVDPTRCIVLVERLLNTDSAIRPYQYVLNADHIYVSHANWTSSGVLGLAFTVVELY